MLSIGGGETGSQARTAYLQPATNDERVPARLSIYAHESQSRMAVTSPLQKWVPQHHPSLT